MPRMLIFDGLPAGSHSWYEDIETGAIVPIPAGSMIPARRVLDPEPYIVNGYAHVEGVEDGTLGDTKRLEHALRKAIYTVKPLPGDASTWTLDEMLAHVEDIRTQEVSEKAAFIAAEAEAVPETIEEIAAADAAGVPAEAEAGGGTSESEPVI